MTQMSIKAGIEQSGQKESDELLKELHQLHSWDALFPKKSTSYQTKTERRHHNTLLELMEHMIWLYLDKARLLV